MTLIKLAANVTAGALLLGLATFGVAALSGIGHRWTDILAQFTSPVLLAAVGVTVVCLVLRLWPASIIGGLTCLVLAVAVWPQWTPKTLIGPMGVWTTAPTALRPSLRSGSRCRIG